MVFVMYMVGRRLGEVRYLSGTWLVGGWVKCGIYQVHTGLVGGWVK